MVQKQYFWQNDSNEILEKKSDIGFDIFEELSGLIFSVQFIIPKRKWLFNGHFPKISL